MYILSKFQILDFEVWDPKLGVEVEVLMPIENLKEIQIGPHVHQVTKIGNSLSAEEERELVIRLKKNVDLFTWAPSDMPDIYKDFVSHLLVILTSAKPVTQRKLEVSEENKVDIDEYVEKLSNVGFIIEMKYPS